MRSYRHYWLAYALFILIPVVILTLVSGYVADWQVRSRTHELSSDLTNHVNNTLDEAESLLLLLADRSQGICTKESLKLMRSLAYDYAYIREAAVINKGQMRCSSWGMHSPAIKMNPIDSVFIPGRWRLTNIHGSEFGDLNNYSNILALGIEADKGVNLLLNQQEFFRPLLSTGEVPVAALITIRANHQPLGMLLPNKNLLMYDETAIKDGLPGSRYTISTESRDGLLRITTEVSPHYFLATWGLLAPIFVGSALFFTALMWGLWHYMKSGRGFSREISSELGRAIRNQEFVIHYLPTMDNQNGLCIGAEALIRWNHPRQGLVMPDIFIPIAERTGMIVPMTQWLIEQLAVEMGEWLKANPTCYLSINISASHFESPFFLKRAYQTLHRHGIHPSQLTLEITERELIDNSCSTTRKVLQLANQYGFKLAIDDFGTGYNNLARLYEFGFELIKIDRSLVRMAVDKEGGDRIFDAVLTVANGYGAPVLVEGVELAADVAFVARRHIHSLQGWHFSKPINSVEFKKFHQAHQTPNVNKLVPEVGYGRPRMASTVVN